MCKMYTCFIPNIGLGVALQKNSICIVKKGIIIGGHHTCEEVADY